MAEIDAGREGGGDEYMTAVVNETLRVRPVVPIVARMLTQELQVGSYRLPRGTRVVPSIYLTNRNPRGVRVPAGVPAGALPGGGAGDVLVDPVRRRHPPLHRRVVRAAGDEADPADDAGRAASRSVPDGRRWRRGEWIRRRAITLVPAAGARVVWERRGERV